MLNRIKTDLTEAQKARDELKVSTLRLLLSAIHNEEIAKQHDLSPDELAAVITREIKKRKEAAAEYERAERAEAAGKGLSELHLLEAYGPELMEEEEIRPIIEKKIAELGKDNAGRIIGEVMKELKGKADGTTVKQIVEQLIAKP
ncbi:GatB/YqeY domain-containing protein [Candidatus Berkelbacteria bacterium]|nr:GatB/YqeY domain-containing protein [Candidatus Berkelbacteria bacterium]